MKLEQLKKEIETNTLSKNLLIFVCKEDSADFVFHQYLHTYSTNNSLTIEFVETIPEQFKASLFQSPLSNLSVLYLDKLTTPVTETSNKLWIKCKSIDKKIEKSISDNIVVVDKLEPWHIKDYVYSLCEKINTKELDYLLSVYGTDIYRIDCELQKILIFKDYEKVYPEIKSQLFNDLSTYGIFDFVNSFVKYDIMTMTNILKELVNIDVDVFGLITLLLNNFKRVIDVQLSRNPTPESVRLNPKQFWAVQKFSCGIYSRNQLLEIYKFLNKCDFYIKSGYVSVEILIDYIVANIMTIKERV